MNTTQGPKVTLSKGKKKENPEEKNGKGLLYINNNKTNEARGKPTNKTHIIPLPTGNSNYKKKVANCMICDHICITSG